MGDYKRMQSIVLLSLLLLSWARPSPAVAPVECSTVTSLLSVCSNFISYGQPDPVPGSSCCDAMRTLDFVGEQSDSRRSICGCLMSLISSYNPNATAIAILPGICGISLGFTIDPNTDCTL
ncbi:hypothetical protein ACFE04_028680 [Oxalis oulophora]